MIPFQATAKLPIFIALLIVAMGFFIGGWHLHGALHFFGLAVLSESVYYGFLAPHFDDKVTDVYEKYPQKDLGPQHIDTNHSYRSKELKTIRHDQSIWRLWLRSVAILLLLFGVLGLTGVTAI